MASITLQSPVTCNPATSTRVVIREVRIDPNDKSVTVNYDLVSALGAQLIPLESRFANATVTTRVDSILAALTTAITNKLGVAGTLDP